MRTNGWSTTNSEAESAEYLAAAQRKLAIADYHLQSLQRAIQDVGTSSGEVPIEIQAHFEGVLYAVIAASDQVAKAIDIGLHLGIEEPVNLKKALQAMPGSRLRTRFFKWQQAGIAADVRDIRRRATHHHYVKAPGALRLEVQRPTRARPYEGPRDLVSYSRAAVRHVISLGPLIEDLGRAITLGQAPD